MLAGRVHSSEARVRQWMTADPIVVSATTAVDAARILMVEHHIHHLPVVEGERPVGTIGMREVVRTEHVPMELGLGLGLGSEMYARAVDDAASRLRDLRQEERGEFGLAALALALSLVATRLRPELAMPLFLGGLVVGALGVRAAWRRWEIVDRLAGEHDAYVISEIREHAVHEATMERRRMLAAYARTWLDEPITHRIDAAAAELNALASELDDDTLTLDPACAVACVRLLSDPGQSPLLNPALPPDELRSRISQIRSGFVSKQETKEVPR